MELNVKHLEYYKRLPYLVIIDRIKEDGIIYFTAEFKELRGCKTEGENEVEAISNLHELFDEYITLHLSEEIEIPEPEKIVITIDSIKANVSIKKYAFKPSITQDSEDTIVESKPQYQYEEMAA